MSSIKPYSPACDRNRDPILSVLQTVFADCRRVLEIGSGTGQHAVHFAKAMPQLVWQTADVQANLAGIQLWLDEAGLANTPPPLTFDCDAEFDCDVKFDGNAEVACDAPLNHLPPHRFDAVFSANTLHIMSWRQVQILFERLPHLLAANAQVAIYGPFNRNGQFTSDSNRAFDASLRRADPLRGIRDLEAVQQLAQHAGLRQVADIEMPSNNACLIWTNARRG